MDKKKEEEEEGVIISYSTPQVYTLLEKERDKGYPILCETAQDVVNKCLTIRNLNTMFDTNGIRDAVASLARIKFDKDSIFSYRWEIDFLREQVKKHLIAVSKLNSVLFPNNFSQYSALYEIYWKLESICACIIRQEERDFFEKRIRQEIRDAEMGWNEKESETPWKFSGKQDCPCFSEVSVAKHALKYHNSARIKKNGRGDPFSWGYYGSISKPHPLVETAFFRNANPVGLVMKDLRP